ncbi:MAG: phosphate regulon transcriptional regulator PhoB [Pseudomonadota bacterium]
MTSKNILIVEDEQAIREMIKFSFFNSEFTLQEAEDVKQARILIANQQPDLILLDWMLPGKNGVDFATELRANNQTTDIPIIMLTAKSEEKDKIHGFAAGMDDYVVKPFSPKELMARINALLRRTSGKKNDLIKVADLELNAQTHRVSCLGNNVNLGPLEYKLLHFFMTHTERVYSRAQLLDQVWGGDAYVEERTVDVHIRRLRKVLIKVNQEKLIQTVRGSGYRFSIYE